MPPLTSSVAWVYRATVPLWLRRALWNLRYPERADAPEPAECAKVQVDLMRLSPEPDAAEQEAGPVPLDVPEPAEVPEFHAPHRAPSYTYKWGESLRIMDALRAAAPSGVAIEHPVNVWAYKLKGYKLAESCGIQCPEVYGVYDTSADVDWDALPRRFVAKSQWGCSSRRVLLLEKADGYRDIRTGDTLKRDELAAWLDSTEGLGDAALDQVSFTSDRSGFWFEQLLYPPPCDWKFYAFYGEIGLITCVDRDAELYGAFDADLSPLSGIFRSHIFPESAELPRPLHPDRLLDAARILSRTIRHPHVSIDLYDTPDGVCFGEATALPGVGCEIHGPMDEILGHMWEQAESRLIASGYPPFSKSVGPGFDESSASQTMR